MPGLKDSARNSIIDIRNNKVESSLEEDILKGMLYKPHGQKSMPTMLLYSAEGLKLFEEITYLEEYYLTNTEIAILEKYAENIAERIHDGTVLIELGSGYELFLSFIGAFLNMGKLDADGGLCLVAVISAKSTFSFKPSIVSGNPSTTMPSTSTLANSSAPSL